MKLPIPPSRYIQDHPGWVGGEPFCRPLDRAPPELEPVDRQELIDDVARLGREIAELRLQLESAALARLDCYGLAERLAAIDPERAEVYRDVALRAGSDLYDLESVRDKLEELD